MVTHSEMLLRRLADALIIFHKGGAEYFEGTYDEFLEKIGWEEEEGSKPKKKKPKIDYKERKRLRKELISERNTLRQPYTKTVTLCETKIESIEKEIAVLETKLAEVSAAGDNSAMIEYSTMLGKLHEEVEQLFASLEEATEKEEAITAEYEEKLAALDV